MSGAPIEEKPLRIRGLLGVGFDGNPQHKRITRGKNFLLFGGSKDTHELMAETCLKFNEHVEKRGKDLAEINARELDEIIGDLSENL